MKAARIFHAHTLGATEEQVRQAFVDRFGRQPTVVFRSGPVMLAGPVRDDVSERSGEMGQRNTKSVTNRAGKRQKRAKKRHKVGENVQKVGEKAHKSVC